MQLLMQIFCFRCYPN